MSVIRIFMLFGINYFSFMASFSNSFYFLLISSYGYLVIFVRSVIIWYYHYRYCCVIVCQLSFIFFVFLFIFCVLYFFHQLQCHQLVQFFFFNQCLYVIVFLYGLIFLLISFFVMLDQSLHRVFIIYFFSFRYSFTSFCTITVHHFLSFTNFTRYQSCFYYLLLSLSIYYCSYIYMLLCMFTMCMLLIHTQGLLMVGCVTQCGNHIGVIGFCHGFFKK